MIYNNQAIGGYLAAKSAYKAQIDSYKSTYQNEIQDVLIAFLKALKAKTLYSVERENLAMTQANIRRAKSRINSGISNKSELYRWQNQLAFVQKTSVDALNASQAAILALTQKIGDRISLRYDIVDINDDDPFYKRAKAVTERFIIDGLFKKHRSKFINYLKNIS